jgi:ABC-type dipeptide/oligopeptide/nickel transport system permease component
MSSLARFLLLRLLLVPLTLLFITALLMALLTTTPPQLRAFLYLPLKIQNNAYMMTLEELRQVSERYIQEYHLEDPFPVQYAYWVSSLFTHGGGYSPTWKGRVFDALLRRTPVTAELTLYSLLLFIPLGIVSGLRAGWRPAAPPDSRFRATAYIAASLPPFITALLLLGFFYAFLGWFPPGRLGIAISQEVLSPNFHHFTGLMTIDSLLNRRLDVFVDSLRHLVLPVFTLSLVHWATLGRIVRSTVIGERSKEYLTAARARGVPERRLLWHHALRNILAPALSSSALAAASLFTGVFMVEIIFDLKGVADLVVQGSRIGLDVPLAMGFTVYSICIVLVIMFVLDVLRAILDPRSRESMI